VLDTTRRFWQRYGEFFAIWKLWNYSFDDLPDVRERTRRLLLEQIARTEADMEALLLQIICERRLQEDEVASIAKFRQVFQTLPKQLRKGKPLEWVNTRDAKYKALKRNAADVAHLVATMHPAQRPDADTSRKQILLVTDGRWEREECWTDPSLSIPSEAGDTDPGESLP
jgi:hypothetical protein